MKLFIVIALVFIFFMGCRTLNMAAFHPDYPTQRKLPGLQINNHISQNYGYGYGMYNGVYVHADADILCSRYVQDNLTQSDGDVYGYVEFKMVIGQSGLAGWGWYALSIGTLCVPNIFGMPLLAAKTQLEIEMDIYDSEKRLIGRFIGKGFGKAKVAFYYGYSAMSAPRVANVAAVSMALREINMQLGLKVDDLDFKLRQGGKISRGN